MLPKNNCFKLLYFFLGLLHKCKIQKNIYLMLKMQCNKIMQNVFEIYLETFNAFPAAKHFLDF